MVLPKSSSGLQALEEGVFRQALRELLLQRLLRNHALGLWNQFVDFVDHHLAALVQLLADLSVVGNLHGLAVLIGSHADVDTLHHLLSGRQNLTGNVAGSSIAGEAGGHHVNDITVGSGIAHGVLRVRCDVDGRLSGQRQVSFAFIHFLQALLQGGDYFQLGLCGHHGDQREADEE